MKRKSKEEKELALLRKKHENALHNETLMTEFDYEEEKALLNKISTLEKIVNRVKKIKSAFVKKFKKAPQKE